jgi:hypothetical protein
MSASVPPIDTAPCDDCGELIDHVRRLWFPTWDPEGALCFD